MAGDKAFYAVELLNLWEEYPAISDRLPTARSPPNMRIPFSTRIGFFLCAITAAASAATTSEFDMTVRPFLQEHCTKCHGEKKQKGKLRLDVLDGSHMAGAVAGCV
jgi:mono/diheme cytochrome c family protein